MTFLVLAGRGLLAADADPNEAAGTAPAPAAPPAGEAAVATPAAASAPADASAPPPQHRLVASLSHDLQFGLAILLGEGYRGIFPYNKGAFCDDAGGDMSAQVCTNRAPVFVDLQPSFGIAESWDFLVDVRIGLEKDFTTERQLMVMPGFRYWLDPQSHVKFFTTLQLLYDPSGQNDPLLTHQTDLGFRNANGLMIEVMRNFGVYFQFGESIGFYRWLSFTVDGGVGVQARVP